MGLLDRWIDKAVTKALVPAGSNWDILYRSYEQMKQGVLSDWWKVGEPYKTIQAVYACVDKIAKAVAALPVRIYRGDQLVEDGALYRLFQAPTPGEDRYRFWTAEVVGLETTGKAYVFMERFRRTTEGRIPAVMWIAPGNMVGKQLDDNGRIEAYHYGKGARKKEYPPNQVIEISLYGSQAPIEAARMDAMLQFYALQYNINFFKQGGQIPGFLRKRDGRQLSPEQETEVERAWARKSSGVGNAHKTPVFSNLEWVQVGTGQKDMEFQAIIERSSERIYQAFGVPKALFGATDTTFANMAEAKRYFYNQTVKPIVRMTEAVFDQQFFERLGIEGRIEFGLDTVPELQTDIREASEAALRFWQIGIPLEEINERLGLGFDLSGATEPEERGADERVQKAIAKEKAINLDPDLLRMEAKAAEERMAPFENEMYRRLSGTFKDLYREAREVFDESVPKTAKAEIDLSRFFEWLEDIDFGSRVVNSIRDTVLSAFNGGARRTYSGVGIDFDLSPDRAEAHMASRQILLSKASDDMKEEVRKVLRGGIVEGDGTETLAKRLSKKFTEFERSRSRAIAQTETTGAYNDGRIQGMKELGITRKQWVNTGDSKVRDSHRINQTVGVEENFTLANGVTIDMPGGNGPASEVVNCRCSVVSVLLDEDEERVLEEAARRRRLQDG